MRRHAIDLCRRGAAVNRPAVSILLPVYNAAATLERALDSIAAQTFADWELIAVDDGSTDASAALLGAWAARDARVRVITAAHRGIAAALNAGLAAARGPRIARMDADDVMLPDRLGAQCAFLDAHGGTGVVSCLAEHAATHGRQEGFEVYVRWVNSILAPREHLLNRFIESPLVHPTAMWRREITECFGPYDETQPWPEDYELWLRLMDAGVVFAKVPQTLYRWYDMPRRLSRIDPRYGVEAFYALKATYLARGPLAGAAGAGVWGAGRTTRARAALLERHGIAIRYYVDIDPHRRGTAIDGRPVMMPEELIAGAPDVPLLSYVASRGARDLIRARLAGTRFREGENFWCVA